MKNLEKTNLTKERQKTLLKLKSFSGVGDLSVEPMKKITPFLEQGKLYYVACEEARYDFKGHKADYKRTKE